MLWTELLLSAAAYVDSTEGRSSPESDHGYASKMPTPQPTRAALSSRTAALAISSSSTLPRGGGTSGAQRRKNRHRSVVVRKQHQYSTSAPGGGRASVASAGCSGNRSLHNQMEKNRRAHMRWCQNKLKEVVPVGPSGRHTTQGLLTSAVRHIKHLEETLRPRQKELDGLMRLHAMLRARLDNETSSKTSYRESKELLSIRLRHGGISPTSTSSDSAGSSLSFLSQSPSPSNCSEPIDVIGTGSDVSSDADEHCSWHSAVSAGARLVPSTSRLLLVD